jgi:isopenicillin N synthase-like dioxygenase
MEKKVYKLYESKEFIENKREITEFCNEVYKDGYVYVECPEELKQIYENLKTISQKFFNLSFEEKEKYKMKGIKTEYKFEVKNEATEKILQEKRNLLKQRDRREFFDITEHTKFMIGPKVLEDSIFFFGSKRFWLFPSNEKEEKESKQQPTNIHFLKRISLT